MVRLRLITDRELGLASSHPTPEETARREAAQQELERQFRALLGDARYQELKAARR